MKTINRPFTEQEMKNHIQRLRDRAAALPKRFWKRKKELLLDADMYERGNIGLKWVYSPDLQ